MLLPVVAYLATWVTTDVGQARVNDAGLVAGLRDARGLGPYHQYPPLSLDGRPQEAFVWKDGKVLLHDPSFTSVVGPNAKGQIALGGAKGLFLWENGTLKECVLTPIGSIAGIADDGSILAATVKASESFPPKPSFVWPSALDAEGKSRFGPTGWPRPSSSEGPSGVRDYAPDGSFLAFHRPMRASQADGGFTIRTRMGLWRYGPRDGLSPNGLASNGYALATQPFATALWHNGDILQLDLSSGKSTNPERDGIRAVNGRSWAVGRVDARAVLWQDGARVDLGNAAGGPRLENAIALSESGNVLATSGRTLYLLRRRS